MYIGKETAMTEDILRRFGHLCLGSRLKRLGERLQADVLRFTESTGLSIQPGQYPLLATIDRNGPQTVGDLTQALGVSQPGVTRNVKHLVEVGLLKITRTHRDQRQRTAALTRLGRQAIERSKREVWPHIEAAVSEICAGLSGPLLEQLGAIEDALAETPLDRRAARRTMARRAQ
jgi:DNA-binding MarR family transcriptional regulator